MKKLLQVNVVSNMLSTGYITEDIAKVASSQGWDCYIAYGRYSKPGINHEFRIGSTFNTYEHYVENRLFDNEGLASRLATRRFIRYITELAPDIVHLHNIHDHYLNYKLLFEYLNQAKIPVVWTIHDFWPITGHCHYFIESNCEKWKTLCYNCPLQHSTVNSLVDRSSRNYNLKKALFNSVQDLTLVPVSFWVEEILKKSFLSNKRIEVIPNGIDVDSFMHGNKKELMGLKNKFVILGVAKEWSNGDRKGLSDFLTLSKMLSEDEVIVLVGLSPIQIKNMPKNIVGIEKTQSKQELADIYRNADVLLSLSRAETFGLTIIEANACGTPAVVYNNTAQPYLISSNTGYVAENLNLKDVYDKIKIVKTKGKKSYSDACISHALSNYNTQIVFQKYAGLYEKLLKKNN